MQTIVVAESTKVHHEAIQESYLAMQTIVVAESTKVHHEAIQES
jgi:hypothetical protein